MNKVEITVGHKIVAYSKNLRGLYDYTRRSNTYISGVTIREQSDGSATMRVFWNNGAQSYIAWNSFTVACDWIRGRRTLFYNAHKQIIPLGECAAE